MGKIVIRTPNHLGDCLMALPAVESLARERPDIEIALLVPQWAEMIYHQVKTARYIPLSGDQLHGLRAISVQTPLLRRERFEHGLLFTPSFSSALIFFRGRVRERYGYTGEGRAFLLNHPLDYSASKIIHRSLRYLHLIEYFLDKKLSLTAPALKLSPFDKANADKIFKDFKIDPRLPVIAMAPQAVAESRRWGVQNYSALADRLVRRYDGQIILLGTKAESSAGAEIVRNNRRIFNLCGHSDIGTAAALLARALLFVGNDSGPAHLAAAVGIPLVVLSGADNPTETSPLSDKKTVIIKDHLSCISCVKNRCPKSGDNFMLCMKEITVDEVFAASQKILEQSLK